MWLSNSSVGRKVVMSVTGAALVLFLLFHMSMNLVALISAEGYNMVCAFLGANWYAVAATVALGAMVVLHFVYALILTVNNYKARGTQRYAVTVNEPGVEWASKNMLLLGFIVVVGLLLHLCHFWSKMMFVELMGHHQNALGFSPTDGAALIEFTFSKWYNVVLMKAGSVTLGKCPLKVLTECSCSICDWPCMSDQHNWFPALPEPHCPAECISIVSS